MQIYDCIYVRNERAVNVSTVSINKKIQIGYVNVFDLRYIILFFIVINLFNHQSPDG